MFSTEQPVALLATGVSKNFGATTALADAHLSVGRGTIHALLGGNGSGKSTLIKCIAGVYQADAGEVRVHGETLAAASITPQVARKLDLRFVHQDLGLFPQLSIAENVGLYGGYPTARGIKAVRWRTLERTVSELLERYEIAARPSDMVASLRPAQRSMVAIARALADQVGDECVLLLDEPTATLAEHEARELLQALRVRADAGQTIVLVSHRFPEVRDIADDVTVFRDGRVAVSDRMSAMPIERLVASMTGNVQAARSETSAAIEGAVDLLTLTGLSSGAVKEFDLTVAEGEIVGLAGLGGSGRSSVLRAVFGSAPVTAGAMSIVGVPHAPAGPASAMSNGVALVPEDRLGDAAFLDLSLRENTSAAVLGSFFERMRMNRRREVASTRQLIDAYRIRASGTEVPLGLLSGGNQQKAVIARWLQRGPRVLLLDEPTQGVDVVARHEIYATVRTASRGGCAVLVASSDLDELLALTHRVVVLRDGEAVAILDTASTSRDEIAHYMMLDGAQSLSEPITKETR